MAIIIDYEKKYMEALERARKIHKFSSDLSEIKLVEQIFPELAESEDERIRKEIISFLKEFEYDHYRNLDFSSWIAWLENQGKKPTDKVEPKFKVGDWITNGDYTWKIIKVEPLDYILQSQDGNIVDDTISHVDEQFHSFTIKDAKDDDVLAKPWSEEDEKMVNEIIAAIDTLYYHRMVNWLRSLKYRVMIK